MKLHFQFMYSIYFRLKLLVIITMLLSLYSINAQQNTFQEIEYAQVLMEKDEF